MRRTALMFALLVALLAAPGEALAAQSAASILRGLVRQTNALPKAAAPKPTRTRLKRRARHALRVHRKRPCGAVRDLARYRKLLGRVKAKKGKRFRRANRRLAALGPASMRSSQKLLASKRTRRCGGGVKPSTRKRTRTRVLRSTATGMRLRVTMPELRLVPRTGGGKTWTQLVLPNTEDASRTGTPAIPVASSNFAVPDGARLVIRTGDVDSYTLGGVQVFPAQGEPVDQDTQPPNFLKPPFADRPFAFSRRTYARKGLVPSKPADADMLGTARDLRIGGLQIPAAQYDARTDRLKVIKQVDVTVNFRGGPHTFSPYLGSPWEFPQVRFASALINSSIIRFPIKDIVRPCGEEMLVITNPATRTAADQFATARRGAGLRTSVVETGAGAGQIGTTPAAIQTFIRGQLTAFLCIHPSYITIMGDDDLVPTFTDGPSGIPSDLKYSLRTDADELPDVAVGRIIGNDQAAVGTAVTKIVNYETSPPTANGMLGKALIAAQFQDDDNDGQENRTFIQFAETVRNGLVNRGVAVDRVYGEHPGNNPQRFNDGTPLPPSLQKPAFGWDGTGAQVSAGWNEGRFMVIHRDHGWSDGWGTPGYGTTDVQALTNGPRLPVVLSINCSSGAYDYDETSFAGESLVKPNGGSVGVFGDTRDSPSTANTQMSLGFVDALLPSVLSGEGPGTKQRMGDALNHGKMRLNGISPLPNGTTRSEFYLWHYYGDPSMQMWGGGTPFVLDPSVFQAIFEAQPVPGPGPGPGPYGVNVTLPVRFAGQPVSLLRNGEVIGKAIAGNGTAKIPAYFGDGAPKQGELEVAMEADGAAPIKVPVQESDTTLSQSCPESLSTNTGPPFTVSGQLKPAPPGATIRLVYTRPDESTFTRTTTTDGNGNWSDTIDPVAESGGSGTFGTWQVQSSFDGSAGFRASQSSVCSVDVND